MSADGARSGVPPVPGVLRLGWLLLMQPLKLHRLLLAWGLEGDPSLIKLWPRVISGDPAARRFVRLWGLLFLLPPALVVALWPLVDDRTRSLPVSVGVLGVLAFGMMLAAFRASRGSALSLARGAIIAPLVGLFVGFWAGRQGGALTGAAIGAAVTGVVFAALFHLLFWPLEALLTLGLASLARLRPSAAARLSRFLPFRHHDLIHLPLPGLRSFSLHLAAEDPDLARDLLAEAAATIGQERPARLALIELQARDFERAAAGRLFTRAAELDLPFLPSPDTLSADSPLRAFQSAARDLSAGGSSHHQRRTALSRAQATLTDLRTITALARRPDDLSRRLLQSARLWLDVIQDEQHRLSQEEAAHPQVPTAFVAGPALTPDRPEEQSLFKGRQDLIQLIDHDLAPDRRGALLVFGQRRMGKTSLRNFLPRVLGTSTLIVVADFQALSEYEHRDTPHRQLLELIAPKLPGAPPLPEGPRWGEALRWLQWVDGALGNQRLLVVIDEVERVEDGIREGWCSTDFLDFLRAAGDSLRHIRFLLLTAYPLHRLGPHWVDKLVSATTRSISYLDEAAAEELVRRPVPDFPDIYPEGGVARILRETHRHPFLIQKACDELCRLLNERGGRRRATDAELTEVLDRILDQADLFDELWRQRTPAERDALRRLAAAPGPSGADPVTRQLAREGYVDKDGDRVDIAVPLFRAWIAETQGPAEGPPST